MYRIYERAQAMSHQLVAWRRQIHAHPELGVDQPETTALVVEALRSMGLEPRLLGGGVTALIQGDKPGKTLLLRADMDALPMEEESGLPFASQVKGAAHTCGHDMHTAMLLGAAQLLVEERASLCGCVKLMFQPGEEVGRGARQMLDAGILTEPRVDAAFGLHTLIASDVPTGSLALSPGPTLASSDLFRITVTGRGCHGSRPEQGIDPINILCHIHTLLQTITSREVPQKEAAVLTIGQISAGNAPNIIPNEGYMTGTIRTFNSEVRSLIKQRMTALAEGTATALGGTAVVEYSASCPPLCNNEALTQELLGYCRELLGEKNVVPMASRLASEDFAEVTNRVPGAFARLSMGSRAEGYCFDGHHPKVVFNESAMPVGAAVYAYGALRWLEVHSS